MSLCGGAARQSLVLSVLLVISAVPAVNGCSECLMYHVMESIYVSMEQSMGTHSLWFQAEGSFNFTFQFFNDPHASDPVTVPVHRDDNCRWREITINLDMNKRPSVQIDGRVTTINISRVYGMWIFISEGAKVLISKNRDLLERNNFCPSNSGKHLDNRPLFILLAITVIVAVIAMIYGTVFHCKYRKLMLVLKPVASPMLNFASEYGQAEEQGNNSELKVSHLSQAFNPQQTAPHNTDLRRAPPQFPSQRPKSHDSMNSIYDPVILS